MDQLLPYISLATALVRTESQPQEDLLQDALLALHRALQRTPHPDKPYRFATTVVRRAILRSRGKWHREPANYTTSLDWLADTGERTGPWTPTIPGELQFYLDALGQGYGEQAKTAAALLLEQQELPVYTAPSRQVKRRLRRSGPSRNEVRRALRLSPNEWRSTLAKIQEFTRAWLAQGG